jgi:hypothetical protein
MYDALINIYPKIKWQGCRIPIIKQREYGFIRPLVEESGWAVRVLERMGFPLFYSSDPEGACFVDENVAPALTDQEILDAIRFHTSGKANMSLLGKLIFVADMVEEDRNYEGVEYLRELFEKDDFEKCFIECLKEEVLHLLNKKQYIYKATLDAYDYYVKERK